MLILPMKVNLFNESDVYRQLACPMYSLTMKTNKDSCCDNINIMKAMSVIVNYEFFMFSTIGLENESEAPFRCRILSLIVQIRKGRCKDEVCEVLDWVKTIQMRPL